MTVSFRFSLILSRDPRKHALLRDGAVFSCGHVRGFDCVEKTYKRRPSDGRSR
jgi:hypothetical protein